MAISKIITSSLTDDAVTSAKIGTDQVGADALSSSAISGAVDIPANSVGQSELSIDLSAQSVPHIVPGVLYPGYDDKQIDGTTALAASTTGPAGSTVASSKYGTVQSDGRMYYYTDIKGSKPIKDPRIGAHFGSQRHQFRSLQILEQETATQGTNTYSVDGREWIRMSGTAPTDIEIKYHGSGNMIKLGKATDFIEITGYFNDINIRLESHPNYDNWTKQLNGGSASAGQSAVTVDSPLTNRYVDSGSVLNVGVGATLGINTVRINSHNDNIYVFGIELIAQDTTSTANRSKIQIPSQDVVSFGKKFNVSGTPHYDPFNGFTSGSSVSSYIDTATSLGVEKWKNSSTYYRPYNGGRVVKWVDSSGVIKTSVTLMPPNAKSIGDSSTLTNGTAKANASVANNTFYPTFEAHTTDVNEDQLHEVAKTFHFREFGNGSANGTITGSYPDASMLDTGTNRDIAYVMDDGLTSLSGDDLRTDSTRGTIRTDGINDNYYITFIGTGFTFTNQSGGTTFGSGDDFDFIVDGVVVKSWQSGNTINEKTTVVQNLPYGTHVFQMLNTAAPAVEHMHAKEFTFHQPKKPPIPEDACVLADYMLMADFVLQNTTVTLGEISKGVRLVSGSRDFFVDSSSALGAGAGVHTQQPTGLRGFQTGSAVVNTTLPFFGTRFLMSMEASNAAHELTINGNSVTETVHDCSADNDGDLKGIPDASVASLGLNTASGAILNGGYRFHFGLFDSPIHTSHHYQSFETPYLHELIGGDRNMEQTNLVCSPDGKTWDEVTRDKSYLASDLVLSTTNNTNTTWDNDIILDEWRGQPLHGGTARAKECFNKDSWAIAYDRLICLEDGTYEMFTVGAFNSHQDIYVNGVSAQLAPNSSHSGVKLIRHMKRGDYIQPKGDFGDNTDVRYSHFYIKKVY